MDKKINKMLQNRVDPFGNIIKTPARGSWMGNRGILHDEHQQIIRPYKLKAWLTCLLEFNGRKRQVMAPNRYTELFFMDEATAFAAGHRPCFECRRQDFSRFKTYWLKGNPAYGFNEKTSIYEIDKILHKERMNKDGSKVMYKENIYHLPSGAFVLVNDEPFLLADNLLHKWTVSGYENEMVISNIKQVTVLTPASIVNTFRAGYIPQMKITA
jgi:hypothetical protein